MDTSQEYINMCEKAGEIQKNWVEWNARKGDFYLWVNNKTKQANIGICYSNRHIPAGKADRRVWLPRQDQLQEMRFSITDPLSICANLDNFVSKEVNADNSKIYSFTSMEQVWLAFVMKEKYGKSWDRKDWVKA